MQSIYLSKDDYFTTLPLPLNYGQGFRILQSTESNTKHFQKKGHQNKNNSNRKSNLEERLSRFFFFFFFCLVIDYYFNGKQLFENRLVLWKETIIAMKQVQKTF